jgi:tetratricopeptide (TPR) repeat protein
MNMMNTNPTNSAENRPASQTYCETSCQEHLQAQGWYEQGLKLMQSNQYETAVFCLDYAIATVPHNPNFWYAKGEALAQMNCYQAALDCFNQTVALQPSHDAAWTFRAAILINLERYPEALASCDRVLSNSEQTEARTEAWIWRGVALQRSGNYKWAYASYNKALGIERLSWVTQIVRSLQDWIRPVASMMNVMVQP